MPTPFRAIKYHDADGNEKTVRFRMNANALCEFEELELKPRGLLIQDLSEVKNSEGQVVRTARFGYSDIRRLLYYGLKWERRDLKIEDVGEIMDDLPLDEISKIISEEMGKTFSVKGEASGEG
jgi:hypothetical protein